MTCTFLSADVGNWSILMTASLQANSILLQILASFARYKPVLLILMISRPKMAFKMSWEIPTTSLDITCFFLFKFSVHHSCLHPGATQSAKQKVMLRHQTFQCQWQCHLFACAMEKSVIQALLYFIFSQYLTWWFNGSLSHFSSLFIWSRWWYKWFGWCWVERKKMYALLCLIDAVRSKAEWEKLYSTADLSSQKWNGLVCCSQHSYFGTFHLKRQGGGCWQWKFSCSLFCLLNLDNTRSNLV